MRVEENFAIAHSSSLELSSLEDVVNLPFCADDFSGKKVLELFMGKPSVVLVGELPMISSVLIVKAFDSKDVAELGRDPAPKSSEKVLVGPGFRLSTTLGEADLSLELAI
jgi:hypothetical protein